MSLEIPSALIRKVQSDLRAAAGLPSYHPDDPNLPSFPKLGELIAEFDPSPAYLRCHKCRGKLLRGVQSTICVFCGAPQLRDEASRPSISYNSTFACRKFLESLGLDGSEPVVMGPAEADSSGGQTAPRDGMALSDLLDLELKWPDFSSQIGKSSMKKAPTLSNPSMNLAGIDLDNFFSDASRDSSTSITNQELIPPKEVKNIGNNVFTQESSDMFPNIQPSEEAVKPIDNMGGQFADNSSDWEAEFQSASFASPLDLKQANIYQVSTTDLARPIESVTATDPLKLDSESQESRGESHSKPDTIPSNMSPNEQWNAGDTITFASIDLFETSARADGKQGDDANSLLFGMDDWLGDGNKLSSGMGLSCNAQNSTENDPWEELTFSGDKQDPFSSSWPQADLNNTITNKSPLDLPVTVHDNSNDMDFGAFFPPNQLSKVSIGPRDDNMYQQATSTVNRMGKTTADTLIDGKFSVAANKAENENMVNSKVAADVDMLISQMHDLSFMLEDKLSCPKKVENSSSIS